MPALITIGIILLFLVFLLTIKATVTIVYAGEVQLFLRVLFIKIRLVPAKKKKYPKSMSAKKAQKIKAKAAKKKAKKLAKKKEKELAKEEEKKAVAKGEVQKEKNTPGEILDIISLVANLIKKVVGKFFGHLTIKLARIKLKIATGDAATTAITYGAVTQAINLLFPVLDNIKTVETPDAKQIDVVADFCSEESEIDIKISFGIRVWHVFHVVFSALGELIKYLFKSMKRKSEKKN